jgi:hypothetical protein
MTGARGAAFQPSTGVVLLPILNGEIASRGHQSGGQKRGGTQAISPVNNKITHDTLLIYSPPAVAFELNAN